MTQKMTFLLSLIVTMLTPVVLILMVVRLLLFPWYLDFEYHLPGFPDDPYGFTLQDRLHWARYAVDYLVNNADISHLGNLRFPEGQQAPMESCTTSYEGGDCTHLYNNRELSHMQDVKLVTQKVLQVWRMALIIVVLLGVAALFAGWGEEYRRALARGAWLTAILSGTIVLLILIAFGLVFVTFHDIFFTKGTWTFLYSDTLIRLFPERFWRDVFLFGLGVPAVIGILMGWLIKKR
jgi:integral membrane protein (TIGR01906 family)